jgi:hypothetical protein
MFEGIMLAVAIFVGIPMLASVAYFAIERYFDRQIEREAERAYWRSRGIVPPAWDMSA